MLGGNEEVGVSPEDDFAYGRGIPADADWRNLLPVAELGLSIAPGSGDAMALRDAWSASGRGADAVSQGRYSDAAGDYANWAAALASALPGAGVVARGTKRGLAWTEKNLPTGMNKLLDVIAPVDAKSQLNVFVPVRDKAKGARARNTFDDLVDDIGPEEANKRVYQETDTLFGPEGGHRFEISDFKADPKREFHAGETLDLSDVIDHPELFAYDPTMRRVKVRFVKSTEGRQVASDPETGDFIVDESFQGKDLRSQLAKLMQYRVNESAGWVNSMRENVNSKIASMETAIAGTERAIEDGLLSETWGRDYIDSLRRTMDEGRSIRNAGMSEPGSYAEAQGFKAVTPLTLRNRRNLEKKFWDKASAGKQEAKTVKQRAYSGPGPGFPYGERMRGVAAVPFASATPEQVAEFVKNWKRYGTGRGNQP